MRKQGRILGLGLIEVLVVVVLLMVLAMFLYPWFIAKSEPGQPKAATPQERAEQVVGNSYIGQINSAIGMYRSDNDNQNPPSLQALKRYGLTDEMLKDPVTQQPLAYDPQTGKVGSPADSALHRVPGF